MNSERVKFYKGYKIENLLLEVYYQGEKMGNTLSWWNITQEKNGKIYFYRSVRLETFRTLDSAKRAIRENRIFVGAEMNV